VTKAAFIAVIFGENRNLAEARIRSWRLSQ